MVRASGFVLLLLAAFASLGDSPQPTIDVTQLPRSDFDVQRRDAVSIAYEMKIRNPSQQAITLREVRMKTVGRSPYVLDGEAVQFSERIEAGGEATVTLSRWARRRSGGRGAHATVWVRGTAKFESDSRAFVTKFTDSFREPD